MIKDIITDKKQLSIPSQLIFDKKRVLEVTQDLIDTACHWQKTKTGCLGLAANQIGHHDRVIVIYHEGGWIPMINPEIEIPDKAKLGYMNEGCLSRPGVRVRKKRSKKIILTYLDMDMNAIQKRYTGMIARVLQHEVCHLDGEFI